MVLYGLIFLEWFDLVSFGLAWFGMIWNDLECFGFGMILYGLVWFRKVWHGLVWFDSKDLSSMCECYIHSITS